MTPNEYQELALRTECDQDAAARRRHYVDTDHDLLATRLSHGIMGLAGEVGELAGAYERWIHYDQGFDRTNFIEELGDCLWYISLAADALGVKLEEIMKANINKLATRYPDKFDKGKAVEENRDRQAEAAAMGAYRKSCCKAMEPYIVGNMAIVRDTSYDEILGEPAYKTVPLADLEKATVDDVDIPKPKSVKGEFYASQTGPRPKMPECLHCRTPLSDRCKYCPECGKGVIVRADIQG